jgi:hypothetical protein
VIYYTDNVASVREDMLHGFFVGWPRRPSAGQGIGAELMRRILDGTDRFYSVDLVCDAPLVPYYERFGMRGASSALLRHPAALEGCPLAGP